MIRPLGHENIINRFNRATKYHLRFNSQRFVPERRQRQRTSVRREDVGRNVPFDSASRLGQRRSPAPSKRRESFLPCRLVHALNLASSTEIDAWRSTLHTVGLFDWSSDGDHPRLDLFLGLRSWSLPSSSFSSGAAHGVRALEVTSGPAPDLPDLRRWRILWRFILVPAVAGGTGPLVMDPDRPADSAM